MSEMLAPARTFFDLYLEGLATRQDIDDFVEAWHNTGDDEERSLAEYLGMTDMEYGLTLMDCELLPLLASHRRRGDSLNAIVAGYLEALLAADDPIDRAAVHALGYWVKDNLPV